MSKHIFITGGVASGIGKGITAASLGRLLKSRGVKVAVQKLDPYLNADPGLLNPLEHGEVFVLDDGSEADLDLGHYERFVDENLTEYSTTTSGKVYGNLLNSEKSGKYNGMTIQVIPHVTNETKQIVYDCAENAKVDVLITEIGGTVGDLESQAFIEAVRQISIEKPHDCLFVHVVLVPHLRLSNEFKTKPTQHSVKTLMSMGIRPDIIVTRSHAPMDSGAVDKISKFCYVEKDCVIQNYDASHLYEVPLVLHRGGLDEVVVKKLGLKCNKADLKEWQAVLDNIHAQQGEIKIALVGKYVDLQDSYLSEVEALAHASYAVGKRVSIKWVDSYKLDDETVDKLLGDCDGIFVPGAFGQRGIDGLMMAAKYARTHNIPYFGLGMGMQVAAIDYARNICNIKDATSTELDENTSTPLINICDGKDVRTKDGSMRIGAYDINLNKGSIISTLYNNSGNNNSVNINNGNNKNENNNNNAVISERHRNRYELNAKIAEQLVQQGLKIGSTSVEGDLIESIELEDHKFYLGVQFQPQFKSRPNRAHPLFLGFLKACVAK